MAPRITESTGLLDTGKEFPQKHSKSCRTAWATLTGIVLVAVVTVLFFRDSVPEAIKPWIGGMHEEPMAAALHILKTSPIIDGHIDLPILVRELYSYNMSAFDLNSPMPAHVDIPRLREGRVGGFFWSVYVDCPNPSEEGPDFVGPTWRVRDTLEQIDAARLMMEQYSDTFSFALTSFDIKHAIAHGKIASLLGVEGGHQLGNSIASLRQYHALGVRYVTLTHSCHNAFADSCGMTPDKEPLHGGLSPLGYKLVDEMNRLGVLVDISHTSDATASQVLKYSKAPVIWSHSSSRAVNDHVRNVPDSVLQLVGTGEGKKDAVIMVNFAPGFVAADPGEADLNIVANHVDHLASVMGKHHIGIGSDYDGIGSTPVGLEDVSKYPALIAELYKRGWNKHELAGLAGRNLLRVLEGAEKVAKALQDKRTLPIYDLYDKRTDIPRQR